MNKKLKRLLLTLLLGPILPLICVSEGDSNNNDEGDAGNGNDSSGNGESENNDNEIKDNKNDGQVIFKSQDDFNKTMSRRLNQHEKKLRSDWENERKKSEMTEVERLKAELTEAETKSNAAIDKANRMLLKANVMSKCTELNIRDADAAFKLMNTEDIENNDGNFTGVEQALKNLINEKPWLVKNNNNDPKPSGDDQNNHPEKNKNTTNANSILRRMAGY